ncbi:uncharacterized protein LOC117897704 [Drosophila subobscura]|uniref:uncharacterized protein LOC117897704 n=1 Tax=Drosophila subobscura TaxID=7241 RepID=UPI00155AB838|nr:uncharacterized protein LOC117897704 [Drosophila subobscura]
MESSAGSAETEDEAEDPSQTRDEDDIDNDVEQSTDSVHYGRRRRNYWLSLYGFEAAEAVRILYIFMRFCHLTDINRLPNGIELRFGSSEQLQRGRLLAQRLVVSQFQLRWRMGRLPRLEHQQGGEERGGSLERESLSLMGRLRRAFVNYFQSMSR